MAYTKPEYNDINFDLEGPGAIDPDLAWDTNKTHSDFELSNDNKTVTALVTGTNHATISEWKKSSGKWYWEIELTQGTGIGASNWGICDVSSGTDYTKSVRAGWNESWAFMGNDRMYHDGVILSNPILAISIGSVLMLAVDIDAGKFWIGKNGVWEGSGNPATGVNPTVSDSAIITDIAACMSLRYSNTPDKYTGRFVEADTDYTSPAGFGFPGSAAVFDETVSGVITEDGSPVARTVRAYAQDTGAFLGGTTSSAADGAYAISINVATEEVFVVAFDDDAGTVYNAVILDQITF